MASYTPPIDETRLIKQLQNPATAHGAFEQVIKNYGEKMYWQIRKLVASHDDANDLLQNAFVKAWNNIHNFRGDARLSTWLYKIAVNESINFLNKERQRREMSESADDMRYFDEMKYEEMSEILGTSVGALKASYHHAMKKVTEYISSLETS